MKLESLDALIIDRTLGELPEEVCELLDAYLLGNPEVAAGAERLQGAMSVTSDVVNNRADLFRAIGDVPIEPPAVAPFLSRTRIAAIAAMIVLAGVSGVLLKPKLTAPVSDFQNPALVTTSHQSPWAKYRIEDSSSETGRSLSVSVEPSN